MEVQLHSHAHARLEERGATEEEVIETIQRGERFPAKFGRTGKQRLACYYSYCKVFLVEEEKI